MSPSNTHMDHCPSPLDIPDSIASLQVDSMPPKDPLSSQKSSPDAAMEEIIVEESQTQTQLELTQLSQDIAPEDSPCLSQQQAPLPPPWGRLVASGKESPQSSIEFDPNKSEYWLGRSSTKCDIPVKPGKGLSNKETNALNWAHSMISNQHCRIFQSNDKAYIEDNSGNGTLINQSIWLRRGEQRRLHSGDEICLVNADTLRRKIPSSRIIQLTVEQYSYIFVQTKARKSCVNPRTMNYHNRRNTPPSPRSGRRIEAHYELREVLGDGTSGQVRRAIHRRTGKEYAVKIISLRRHLDTNNMEREVSLLQSLDHPYIVQLVDVFLHHGVAMYLVMELVAGGDLFDRIVEQQCYTEIDARRVMRRLLSAIHYLHESCNIVHRDLKPENILCQSPTDVKLADFGLAKIMKDDGLKTFCGTPQYFAPEVLQRRNTVAGAGRYGKPADMWSLGVIFYILLTGRPPFGADMDEPQLLDFEDAVWKSMPVAQELVQQLLRLDPKRRLSVAQACDHPWINVDDGDTHIHPLDDPAVAAKKRLFDDNEGKEEPMPRDEKEGADEDNSIVSKTDSVLSKEEFAAAATSHQRSDSVCRYELVDSKNAEKANQSEIKEPAENEEKQIDSPADMEVDKDAEIRKNVNNAKKDEAESALSSEKVSTKISSSPEAHIFGNSSVTPSECGDDDKMNPAKSSTEEVTNFNKRSNRFRAMVLGEEKGSPGKSQQSHMIQTAVTPSTSNVSKFGALSRPKFDGKQDSDKQEKEAIDDDIISRFSSAPSSLESFPDTPPSSKGKRLLANEEAGKQLDDKQEQPSAKRQKKSSKQTTLSSWFVKKRSLNGTSTKDMGNEEQEQ